MFFLNSVISNQICTPAKTRPKTNESYFRFDRDLKSHSKAQNILRRSPGHSHMSKRLNLGGPAAKRHRAISSGDDRTRSLMQTPVSAAVKARKWFNQIMTALPEAPSKNLLRFFMECSKSPCNMISNLAKTLPRRHIDSRHIVSGSSPRRDRTSSPSSQSSTPKISLFSSSQGSNGTNHEKDLILENNGDDVQEDQDQKKSALMISPILAPRGKLTDHRLERCRSCCVRLYYSSLESLLMTEEARLGTSCHEALLSNASFHRALLACCMEVALKSCNYVTLAFPCTLNTFEVTPFDLCKMVESFVRHQPSLPIMLRKHLGNVEEQIVESMAWHGPHIRAQQGHGQDTPDGLPSKSVELLIRKTQRLAVERMVKLAMMLKIPVNIIETLRDSVEWAIDRARSLLYDRHLDNTILCVLYGVAKVMRLKPEVSFKKIIAAHKKCNGAKLEIIRHVVLANSNERGDVIQFYNKVFIPKMKSYLLSLTSKVEESSSSSVKNGGTADSKVGKNKKRTRKTENVTERTPKKSKNSSDTTKTMTNGADLTEKTEGDQATDKSPRRMGNTNVFLMPRRVSMTPRTRALYAFGESPRRDLMRINRAVNPIPSISEIFASASKEDSKGTGCDDSEAYLMNRHGGKKKK